MSLIRAGDNPDITAERQLASFSVRALASFIHGGDEKLKRRDEIAAFVESTPGLLDPEPVEFMTREQQVENTARKAVCMTDNSDQIDGSDYYGEGMFYQSLVIGRDLHPLSLHYVMFLPTLQDKWLPLAIGRGIVGTYAQTELGHGTNLSGLETTATYDRETQEFILHTPTITAAKWWPGGLGKSSNYAVVIAQLYTNGKCYGPHPFIVQLRDLETHQPLPGIKVGDIGPKFGINASDNGFLLFNQFRIPRNHMLMRHAQVLPSGEYVKPSHAKLGYGTMVFVRSVMIRDQAMQLGMAVTIAVRYSSIRRQGEIEPGSEVRLLDYQTQQYRLFPQVARSLAFIFAAQKVRDLYMHVNERLASDGDFGLLPELHALSSGLKAVVSWDVARGIEQCRLSCGGHGYSLASGIPQLYAFAVGGCTYEGDNIVMLLQMARFLMKAADRVIAGNANLAEITDYLVHRTSNKSSTTTSDNTHQYHRSIIADFEHVAREKIFTVADGLKQLRTNGRSKERAWNECSIELTKAAKAHVRLYLVKTFFATVAECTDASIQPVLNQLAQLFAINEICNDSGSFLKNNYMSVEQLTAINRRRIELLAGLRPQIVSIVDGFDFRDLELRSVLGRRDGNVYENLLRWAEMSQLNKSDVLTTFDKHLGPMMRDGRSKI